MLFGLMVALSCPLCLLGQTFVCSKQLYVCRMSKHPKCAWFECRRCTFTEVALLGLYLVSVVLELAIVENEQLAVFLTVFSLYVNNDLVSCICFEIN